VDLDKALKEYEAWVEKHPDNERGLLKLGRLYARKFSFSNALARYDKLLAIDPHNALYQGEKIQLFFDWGRGDEALALLKTLLIPHVDDVIEEKLKQLAENAEDHEIKDELVRFLSKRSKGSVYQFYEKIFGEIKKKGLPEKLLPMMERIRLYLYGDYLMQKRAHDKGGIFSIIPRS
jgi:tetratricopeptide (TPR) repeat protein